MAAQKIPSATIRAAMKNCGPTMKRRRRGQNPRVNLRIIEVGPQLLLFGRVEKNLVEKN